MKKNLIIVLMIAVTMPLYFLSDIGYPAQSRKASTFTFPEGADNKNISDDSALNPSGF